MYEPLINKRLSAAYKPFYKQKNAEDTINK